MVGHSCSEAGDNHRVLSSENHPQGTWSPNSGDRNTRWFIHRHAAGPSRHPLLTMPTLGPSLRTASAPALEPTGLSPSAPSLPPAEALPCLARLGPPAHSSLCCLWHLDFRWMGLREDGKWQWLARPWSPRAPALAPSCLTSSCPMLRPPHTGTSCCQPCLAPPGPPPPCVLGRHSSQVAPSKTFPPSAALGQGASEGLDREG